MYIYRNDTHIYMYTSYTYICIYIYIYIYILTHTHIHISVLLYLQRDGGEEDLALEPVDSPIDNTLHTKEHISNILISIGLLCNILNL